MQTSSLGIEGYDFEQAFPASLDEKTGKKAIGLPIPEFYSNESHTSASVNSFSEDHEALRDDLDAERKNLHDFLLK